MDMIAVDTLLSKIAKEIELEGKAANMFLNVEATNQTPHAMEANKKSSIFQLRKYLPDYEPNEEMLASMDMKFTFESLTVNNPKLVDYIANRKLEFYNVCSVMKTLITIEDMSNMKLYAQLVESNVVIHKEKTRGCYSFLLTNYDKTISLEDLVTAKIDEVVLIRKCSLVISPLPKSILCLLPHSHEELPIKDAARRYIGSVEQVKGSKVEIRFKRYPGDKELLGEKFTIIIRSRRIPYRFMYRALKILQESPLDRLYLFPFPAWLNEMRTSDLTQSVGNIPPWMRNKANDENLPAPQALCLINETIGSNPEQMQAVKRIVAGPSRKGPFIVFGPPGTGKTTTIVEAILQLLLNQKDSKILVTAGSNSACDTIAERLCEYFENIAEQIDKLMRETKISCPSINDKVIQTTNHQKASSNVLLRLFSRSICDKGLNTVSKTLLKYSNFSKGQYVHLPLVEIWKYDIVVATLCTVGRLVHEKAYFTHIFIDEAGAITEPEALIGIMGIRHGQDCHVILSGDHKQLGAVLKSKRAEDLGFDRSLMERLLSLDNYKVNENGSYDTTLQARLRQNYRSHPEIVRLYNTLYYDGELTAHASLEQLKNVSNWNILPNAKFPIIFQATHGKMKQESKSTSSYNDLEIQVVCWYVRRLLEDKSMDIEQEDIGIVAPYLAQGKILTKRLKHQGHSQVEVGTVESYQGREKAIIIVTLVRSFKSIGFMQSPRRINVFLSRAKSLLILVGNPVTLRHNSDFQFIINECKRHGTFLCKKKNPVLQPNLFADTDDDEDDNESIDNLIREMSKVFNNSRDICKVH